MVLLNILLQLNLDGFKEASELNTLFGVLVSIIVILAGAIIILYNSTTSKSSKIEVLAKEHLKKIEEISKLHSEELKEIRKESQGREETRINQIKETEKEILKILNGLGQILEMDGKQQINDYQRIYDQLNDMKKTMNVILEAMMKRNL